MAGAAACRGDYLLMMADHMFDAEILRRLMAEGAPDRAVTLAVDEDTANPLVDPDDATWVRRDAAGRITAIGKTISEYDCVDCGAFLATPALADAIGAAIAAGKPGSLSDGMQRLADQGLAQTMEVGGLWWMDVDDPRAHALAERDAPARMSETYRAALA
jgi:choline kinase